MKDLYDEENRKPFIMMIYYLGLPRLRAAKSDTHQRHHSFTPVLFTIVDAGSNFVQF